MGRFIKLTLSLFALAIMFGGVASHEVKAADPVGGYGQDNPWAGTKWMIRARAIGMIPDENDGRLGGAAADLGVNDDYMPELDFTYFLDDNFALELIAATTNHDVDLGGNKISELWVLPPTLTLQYHLPMGAFKPYVGAGINYTIIWRSKATAAIGGIDQWDDSVGFALQAGFDYAIDDKWSFNMDVKKLWLNLDAQVTAAGTAASVDLDPWVVGAGIGYRF